MSKSTFIQIKSDDRDSGNSSSFLLTLPRPIRDAKRLSLLNAELPVTFYTIRSGYNNTFHFRRQTSSFTASVSEGVYTITTLLTALATAMTTADPDTSVTFSVSSTTNKVTMTSNNGSSMRIITLTTLGKQLGFTETTSLATSTTAASAYSIGDNVVFMRLANISSTNMMGIAAAFRIPITQDAGYVEFYNANSSSIQYVDLDGSTLSFLQVSLIDRYGNDLSLNGAEWSLFLRVDHD